MPKFNVVNPNPRNAWSVGAFCFCVLPYHECPSSCVIQNLYAYDDAEMATVKDLANLGTFELPVRALFSTLESAHDAVIGARQAYVNEIKAQLNSVEDLVRFAYENPVARCEEYTNWDARQAYRERVREILGIDLEPDAGQTA